MVAIEKRSAISVLASDLGPVQKDAIRTACAEEELRLLLAIAFDACRENRANADVRAHEGVEIDVAEDAALGRSAQLDRPLLPLRAEAFAHIARDKKLGLRHSIKPRLPFIIERADEAKVSDETERIHELTRALQLTLMDELTSKKPRDQIATERRNRAIARERLELSAEHAPRHTAVELAQQKERNDPFGLLCLCLGLPCKRPNARAIGTLGLGMA